MIFGTDTTITAAVPIVHPCQKTLACWASGWHHQFRWSRRRVQFFRPHSLLTNVNVNRVTRTCSRVGLFINVCQRLIAVILQMLKDFLDSYLACLLMSVYPMASSLLDWGVPLSSELAWICWYYVYCGIETCSVVREIGHCELFWSAWGNSSKSS